MAWTEDGELFTFGKGEKGQLGHGGEANELVPRLVEALAGKKVVSASAAHRHTVVATALGEVFTFGYSDKGGLGLGQGIAATATPMLVQAHGCLIRSRSSLGQGLSSNQHRSTSIRMAHRAPDPDS